ncbi:MAG: DUF1858 domain-containing protein [Deltaproteobacteria bacterium]
MAGEGITKDMMIGAVMEQYPSTIGVFKKWFGQGCFSCPGAKNEDIAFGSMMHNVELDKVLGELNIAIKTDTGS